MKNQSTLLSFSTFVLLGTLGNSASAYINDRNPVMSEARLNAIIAANPSATTLDQIPALLPSDYLVNFVLKHGIKRLGERGHLNETRISQSSDPHAPRVIMWDERSGYTLSYNGGAAGQTHGQRLDTLGFDNTTKKWKLTAVDFPIQPGRAVHAMTDCLDCHGADQRPIFSMYPDWPAFYGSDNDELTDANDPIQQVELRDYQNFRAQAAVTHPRYSPMFSAAVMRATLNVTPYLTFPYRQNIDSARNAVSRAFAFRPALRLGILYNRLHSQNIFARIQNHANYRLLGEYFLHGILQCRWSSPQAHAATSELREVQRIIGRVPRRLAQGDTLHYRDLLAIFGLRVNDVDIRYSYGHTGYDSDDANDAPMEVGYIGNFWNSYFDGSATIDELVAYQVYQDISSRMLNRRLRGLVPNAQGLSPKYRDAQARFAFDQRFFAEMDARSMWIPIPYPRDPNGINLTEIHHREGYPATYQTQHRTLCATLEARIIR